MDSNCHRIFIYVSDVTDHPHLLNNKIYSTSDVRDSTLNICHNLFL